MWGKSVNRLRDNYGDRTMDRYTKTELTAWEPRELEEIGEPGVTAFDLPNHYEHENHGTTSSLSGSFQTDHMSVIEPDSYTSAWSAEAPSQNFIANWSRAADETMQLSPATGTLASLANSFKDEKKIIGERDLNRERSQLLFIPPSHLSFSRENTMTHDQTARSLVDSLAQVFHSQNNGMLNILGNILDPSDYDAYSAISSTFQIGIKALQRYYCGFVLETFREVFSLTRIAFAAACLLHHGQFSFSWDQMFQDVIQWKENIADPSEASLFLTAIEAFHSLYKRSGGNYSRMNCACSFWMTSSADLAWYEHTSRSLSINPPTEIGQPPLSSGQRLELTVCAQFLYHIERSRAPSQNLARVSSTGFVARSFHPTQQAEGEPLMHELNPAWRSRQYVIQLEWVLAVFEDLVKTQGQMKNAAGEEELQGREQAVDATPVQVHDSPIYIGIDTTNFTSEFSQEGVASSFTIPSTSLSGDGVATDSFTLPRSAEPSASDCEQLPSKNSSNAPIDAPILAPLPGPKVRPCVLCPKVFKGVQDSKNNLRRHVKQFHNDNCTWKHACKVSGCGKVYSRSDYLQNHCEKVHGQPARTVIRRRKAKSDNNQDLQTHDILHQGRF